MGRAFFSQFLFDAFGHGVQMFADRLRIGRFGDRQDFFQQVHRLLKRNQRGPLRLQIQQLRTGARLLYPGRGRPECPWTFGLAWTTPHLGFGTSTSPNTVLIVCVPASLL